MASIQSIENVPGLYYVENIIDPTYSAQLIDYLDHMGIWSSVTLSSNSRKVQHYGYKYNYKNHNNKELSIPIPDILSDLIYTLTSAVKELEMPDVPSEFNQVIVNNYEPGQGISKHTDLLSYGPVIGCYTIGSGAKMYFKKDNEIVELYVEPNSLYIMSGESRYQWTHEMPSTKTDLVDGKRIPRERRISITFRHVDI